jgi:nicotinate (nicotinamide) nucleotide adenylyltransferase
MEFFLRATVSPRRLGIFPGAFNPPTRAHLALARAALACVDEVLFVLPRVFPHKEYEGASFEQRVAMLRAALAGESRVSIASTERGLFIDIALECRAEYGSGVSLAFLCGRDAAERIVNWDYGREGAIEGMLDMFSLLVACRKGEYTPPPRLAHRISPLPVSEPLDDVSASEVRNRIREGRPWQDLVPAEIEHQVRAYYGG